MSKQLESPEEIEEKKIVKSFYEADMVSCVTFLVLKQEQQQKNRTAGWI